MANFNKIITYIKEHTFLKLFLVTFLALGVIYAIHPILFGTLGYDYSDGTIQYKAYIKSFFDSIKSGNFSTFDINNFYGNSFFALTYYIPFDFFAFIMFLLAFINYNFAFTLTRLLMVLAGVMMFYFTSRKVFKFNEKTSFLISLIYLVNGSIGIYNCYYTFLGLYFYVPFVLYALNVSHTKKEHSLLLVVITLTMLFSFYLGYIIVISDVIILFIFNLYNKKEDDNLKTYIISELKAYLIDGIFVIIGVLNSSAILIPSLYYLSSINIANRHFPFSFSMLYELIIRTLIPSEEANFFFLKSNNYISGQRSLYITSFGILSIINLIGLNKKDLKKNIILISSLAVMILIPIFSFILSGSLSNYGRWYFLITIINLYLVGLNYEQDELKLSFFNTKRKKYLVFIPYILMLIITVILDLNNKFFNNSAIYIILMLCFIIYVMWFSLRHYKTRKLFIAIELIIALIITFRCTTIRNNNFVNYENQDLKSFEYFDENNNDDSLYKTYITSFLNDKTNMNSKTNGLVNEGIMFSSFYNTNTNLYLDKYEGDPYIYETWYANTKAEALPNSSEFFNNKYIMVEKDNKYNIAVPSFYKLINKDEHYYYYINEQEAGFATIYYNFHNNLSDNAYQNINTIDKSCYYDKATETYNYADNSKFYDLSLKQTNNELIEEFSQLSYEIPKEYFKEGKLYFSNKNLLTIDNNNNINFYLGNSFVYNKSVEKVYFINYYSSTYEYVNFRLYESEVEEYSSQIEQTDVNYKNGTFTINYNKTKDDMCIIAMPIAYNDDFTSNYELVEVNGGFIGVIIPKDEKGDINITITFKAKGSKLGAYLSLIFTSISLGYVGLELIKENKKEML